MTFELGASSGQSSGLGMGVPPRGQGYLGMEGSRGRFKANSFVTLSYLKARIDSFVFLNSILPITIPAQPPGPPPGGGPINIQKLPSLP